MTGFVVAAAIVSVGSVFSIAPLRRPFSAGIVSWLFSAVVNESPVLGAYYLAFSTTLALADDSLDRTVVVSVSAAAACFLIVGAVVTTRRALQSRGVLAVALTDAGIETSAATSRRLPWYRIWLAPLPVHGWRVRRRGGVRYGPHRRQRLDVFGPRRPTGVPAPVIIHLHGGAFRSGRKNFYARPLLHTLPQRGWVCVSASYRLRPTPYVDILGDVKLIIAWVRENAGALGVNPDRIVLAGSSAGAHLALSAAFTGNAPEYQPGFEGVDTSVAHVVGLYGYYGPASAEASHLTPARLAHRNIPPVMIVHGTNDTGVPPGLVENLVATLQAVSVNAVAFAYLPGAQHTFDLSYSVRFCSVVDAIDALMP